MFSLQTAWCEALVQRNRVTEIISVGMSSSSIDALEARLKSLEEALAALQAGQTDTISNGDAAINVLAVALVLSLQAGFAMLEVGSIHPKNTKVMLLKNLGDVTIAALCWWSVGYGFAYGTNNNTFIGSEGFFLATSGTEFENDSSAAEFTAVWLLGWAFQATCVTIVSGAIAERMGFIAYCTYAILASSIIYPPMARWVWSPSGWASSRRTDGEFLFSCGAIDWSGSGIVHCSGGLMALILCACVGARIGRFTEDGKANRMVQQSPALQALGCIMLWSGWLLFNGSGYPHYFGNALPMARAAVNAVLCPAAAFTSACLYMMKMKGKVKLDSAINALLCGLVSITAGCATVESSGAVIIGMVAGPLCLWGEYMLLRFRIDDIVSASAVHFLGGCWGVIATGLFTSPDGYRASISTDPERVNMCCGVFYGCGWRLLAANICLGLSIIGWVCTWMCVLVGLLAVSSSLRVARSCELEGMDATRHGVPDPHHITIAALSPTLGSFRDD